MKPLVVLLTFLALATSLNAQNSVPVFLYPDGKSPQIGSLESLSSAVSAQWPVGFEAIPGWRPIFYRGNFEVYVSNNDIAKDLSVKPGSAYMLGNSKGSPKLATATASDQTAILSVDTWHCKLRLETIVMAYIQVAPNLAPTPKSPKSTQKAGGAVQSRDIEGTLVKLGQLEKTRVNQSFKIVAPSGKILAYLDTSKLSSLVQINEYIDRNVRATGHISESAEGDLVMTVRALKKAN